MKLSDAQRFSRHIALAEVGPLGQQRIFEALVALVVSPEAGVGLEAAAMYLAASGVRRFRVLVAETAAVPVWLTSLQSAYPLAHFETISVATSGLSWSFGLEGSSVAVRDSFADDSFTEACRRRAIPAVVIRSEEDSLDLLSLRPSSKTVPTLVPSIPPSPKAWTRPAQAMHESAKVVAGTLAAAESIWLLAGRVSSEDDFTKVENGLIRHLRVPFSSPTERPLTRNIPWPPV